MEAQNTSAAGGEGGNAGAGSLLSGVSRGQSNTNSGSAGAGANPQAGANGQAAGAAASGVPQDWRATLPDDLKAEESLKTINDIPSLAKSYIHAQKMIGANKVGIPSKHATQEDWQQFYKQIGLPEEGEYKVALKDAKYVNQDFVKEITPVAHKLGVMPSQLQGILEWYEGKSAAEIQKYQSGKDTAFKTELQALQTEWGKAFDSRLAYGERVLNEMGGKEVVEYLKQTGLNNDLKLVKFLGTIGEKLYKEDVPPGGSAASGGALDPATASSKVNEILADFQHPYHIQSHPKHDAAVQEVKMLMDMAYPESSSKG